MFTKNGEIRIKDKIKEFNNDHLKLRLVSRECKWDGIKRAGHFMRNIGMYEVVTILDRHILKNLHKHGVIEEVPNPLTKKHYMDIEGKNVRILQRNRDKTRRNRPIILERRDWRSF